MKENKMGSAPMLSLIISMSIPSMISMTIQALYNIVDSVFVSYYAQEGLTAITLAFPVQMLQIAISVGTGVGINSFVSRKLGEKRGDLANIAASYGLYLGMLCYIPFIVFGLFFADTFSAAFSDTPAVIEMTASYLKIITIFSFAQLTHIVAEKTVQATGNMVEPMKAHLLGAITNIILDPILIFGWIGAPRMGIAGAAVATVIGQCLSMTYMLYVLWHKQNILKVSYKQLKFNSEILKDIYAVALPSIIMQSLGSFLGVCLNGILAGFSDVAVNVLGVYNKLQSFLFMPVFGLTQGLMPIIGYNYGAKNKDRMIEALKRGTVVAVCIMAVGTAGFWIFPELLLGIFDADAALIEMGVPALRSLSTCFMFAGVNIVFSVLFQALGNGRYSMYMSFSRQMLVLLPVAYVMSFIGLNYVWWSFFIAEIVCIILCLYFMKRIFREKIDVL